MPRICPEIRSKTELTETQKTIPCLLKLLFSLGVMSCRIMGHNTGNIATKGNFCCRHFESHAIREELFPFKYCDGLIYSPDAVNWLHTHLQKKSCFITLSMHACMVRVEKNLHLNRSNFCLALLTSFECNLDCATINVCRYMVVITRTFTKDRNKSCWGDVFPFNVSSSVLLTTLVSKFTK